LARELFERLGTKKHFIRIARHAPPAQAADAIRNLRGMRAAIGEIAAVEDQVGRCLAQIRQNCFEGREIAVNVGYDGDAHSRF
jgi:hypothetical protein